MKLTWKIFFVFTALITVIFSVFGVWIISASFNNSLNRVISEGNRESKMIRLAFEVNLNAVKESNLNDDIIAELSGIIMRNMDANGYIFKVYREDRKLYQSSGLLLDNHIREYMTEDINSGYEIISKDENVYVVFMCRSEAAGEALYIEMIKDITELYSERESFYYQYCIVIAVLLVCTGVVVLVLSKMLTKSVVELSDTTRQFTDGNYSVRAKIMDNDEIGRLAGDFNSMADSLELKIAELKSEVRKQEDFSASFAHELKTPMTSIIGYAEMLRMGGLSEEETLEATGYIYSEGRRLESLSRKLLSLVEIDRQELKFKVINVRDIIARALEINSTGINKKDIRIDVKIEEENILGEYDLLVSLFSNLIDNAVKASSIRKCITISGKKCKNDYILKVEDEGHGIPKEEIEKITEAFYMVDKSRARSEGGSGLGLSLCSKIVSLHNARMSIESEMGEGTVVSVVFENAWASVQERSVKLKKLDMQCQPIAEGDFAWADVQRKQRWGR